jgi:hypothetical protein
MSPIPPLWLRFKPDHVPFLFNWNLSAFLWVLAKIDRP